MKLKTYVGGDLQEALARVKQELGPEAIILSTQSHRRKAAKSGWGHRRGVEVTAAVDLAAAPDSLPTAQAWPVNSLEYGPVLFRLQEELEDMKALLRQWMGEQGPPSWLVPHRELTALHEDLMRAGVHEQVIHRWLEKVKKLLQGKDQQKNNLKERALRQLMQAVEVVDPWKTPKAGPHRWTFLGPTGVGKTTTIAKLAVRAAFMKKKQVGLISLDNVRLGGHDQLAAYARITGLPLAAVQNRRELTEALEKMTDMDVILVDTPGRNPRAPELSRELHQLLGELPGLEHHLVLSATTKEGNLANTLQGFGGLPLASCIVTKVDESLEFAGIFNQLSTKGVPVSYLSTGQRVPEDIEQATRRRLVGLLLNPQNGQSPTQ